MTISSLNEKIESVIGHEKNENLEIDVSGIANNEFYIFTQELNADEEKVGVPVAICAVTEIIIHKGDQITIQFINLVEESDNIHSLWNHH